MSFLSGKLIRSGADLAVRLRDDRQIPVNGIASTAESVVVGIRPEAYEIDPDGPLHIAVEVLEPTGAELFVYGRIADEPVRCMFRGRPPVALGDTLRARVAMEHVHLFDEKSSIRL